MTGRKLARAHAWFTRFIGYEAHEFCARCNVQKGREMRGCLTDNELAEREAVRVEAEKAAHAFARLRSGAGRLSQVSHSGRDADSQAPNLNWPGPDAPEGWRTVRREGHDHIIERDAG